MRGEERYFLKNWMVIGETLVVVFCIATLILYPSTAYSKNVCCENRKPMVRGFDIESINAKESKSRVGSTKDISTSDLTAHSKKKIDKQFVPGQIIVKFKGNIDGEIRSSKTVFGIQSIDKLNAKYGILGVEKLQSIPIQNTYKLYLKENVDVLSAVKEYEKNPHVEYAEPNYIYHIFVTPNDPGFAYQWAFNQSTDHDVDAPEAWDVTTGNGSVTIAVIDTGVDYDHPDLAGNIWINVDETPGNGVDDDGNGYIDDVKGWDFVNNDNDSKDDHGHGTHCAGIIGAVGNNNKGVAGVCWNCSIMSIKCLDEQGEGTEENLADGIIYAANNGADIISMSWGKYVHSQLLKDALDYAYQKGVLLVAAAGNNDTNMKTYPAAYDNVIAVAATNQNDEKAGFSNHGYWVSLAAPGVQIYSTMPTYQVTLNDQGYANMSGTSMACPFVAGVAGLILSKNNFTQQELKTVLQSTTDEITSTNYIGVGRINAYNAVLRNSTPVTILNPSLNGIQVNGVVNITGTANGSGFKNYTVCYGRDVYPTSWEKINNSSVAVNNSVLAVWNTTTLDDGVYTIRLMVYNQSNILSEDRILLKVSNTGNILYVGGNGVGNYTRIQDAIDNASNGDTVYVYNGTYYENVVVNKSITLQGEDKNTTIIDGSQNGNVITVTVDWVNISGFTIQNASEDSESGVYVTSDYNTITSNVFKINDIGVSLNSSSNNMVKLNEFVNNEYGLSMVSSNNNIVTGNIIYNSSLDPWEKPMYGVYLINSSHNDISNNTIFNVTYGILASSINLASYNNITGNTFLNSSIAVILFGEDNCTIAENTIQGLSPGSFLVSIGVYLVSSSYIDVFNNTISNTLGGIYSVGSFFLSHNDIVNNTISDNMVGVALFLEDNCTVTHNTLLDNNISIALQGSRDTNVFYNTICNSTSHGIYLVGAPNNTIMWNNLTGNQIGVYVGNNSNYTIIRYNNITDNNRGIYVYGHAVVGHIVDTVFRDSFEDGDANGWVVHDISGSSYTWEVNDTLPWWVWDFEYQNGSYFLVMDDDAAPYGVNNTDSVVTPSIDCSGYHNVHLLFAVDFRDFMGYGEFWVNVSNNSGATWHNVWYENETNETFVIVNISLYADEEEILINFTYADNHGEGFGVVVDNVTVCTYEYTLVYHNTDTHVNWNNIYNNVEYGAIYDSGGGPFVIDGAYNYWGSATGPYNATYNPSGLGDNVSATVSYCPWLDAPYPHGNSVGVKNLNTGITYHMIQEAIDDANNGDTIKVYPGIYRENLVVNKEIKLIGDPTLDANGGIGIKVEANNTLVENLTISNASKGVYVHNNSFTIQNVTINNCIIYNCTYGGVDNGYGVELDDVEEGVINNNSVHNCSHHGIRLRSTDNLTISNNTFSNNAFDGVYLDTSSDNNTIILNDVYNNSVYGIEVYSSSNNLITLNDVYNNTCGVRLHSSFNNTILLNNIGSNTWGIHLYSSGYNTILRNEIHNNNGTSIYSSGVYLYPSTSHNVVSNNSFYSNKNGLYLWSNANDNIIRNNTLENNINYGIYVTSSNDNQIYNNYFNNTFNAYDSGNNLWNTTKTLGRNIVGGPYLGGNYWNDYDDIDVDHDGFGDINYTISSGNIDFYPLVVSPTVVSTTPSSGATRVSRSTNIVVAFNKHMNQTSVENNFSIHPSVTGVFSWSNNSTTLTFSPSSSLKYSKKYTITIWWNATDEQGNVMPENYSWSFTTESKQSDGDSGIGRYPSNSPPVANADGPYSGYVGYAVSFDGSGSYDLDGGIANYTWDFGDGSVGYGVNPMHVYIAAGTYTVNLTVTDNGVPVLSDTTSTTVNVTEKPAAKKPPVAKTTGPYHGLTNQNITFDGSASYDVDGSIVNYTWDFGDGSVGYGVKPTHVYMVAGTFDVLLTVKDNDGLTNTTKTTATIELDSDGDGWSDEEEQRYGFDPNNSSSMPEDTDDDHVPDIVDSDDDNDGLPDDVETLVGSDPQNETNATNVTVADSNNYLVDTDNDGVYDTFYNPDTDTKTTVAKDQRGRYLIDFDGDGTVDYVYDPASGSVNSYGEVTPGAEIPWLLVAVVVIFAVIAITVVLYFRKKI